MSNNDEKPEEEEEEEEEEGDDTGSGAEETEQEPEDVGVPAKEVDDLINTEKWHASVHKAAESILQNKQDSFFDSEGKVSEEIFLQLLSRFRGLQKQRLASSKWVFHPIIHRHANIIPYDDNAMRDHIGSWMGDGIGMMQWPVGSKKYNELLLKVIEENNVGAIVALGPQDPNERTKMVSYWETLGVSYTKADDVPGDESYRLTLANGQTLLVIRVIKWEDFGVPTAEQLALFERVFHFLRTLQSQKDSKRVIFHCRAGVGRSGTFYLMYKAFKGLVTKETLLRRWVELRYMRVETIQTVTQLNFAVTYVNSISTSSPPKILKQKSEEKELVPGSELPQDNPSLIITPSHEQRSPREKGKGDLKHEAPNPEPVPSPHWQDTEEEVDQSKYILEDERQTALQMLERFIDSVKNHVSRH